MIALLAHTVPPPSDGGGGGANVPLVVVGVAAVVAGLVLAGRGVGQRWLPWAVVAAGLAVGVGGYLVGDDGGGAGRPDATVTVVSPEDGAEVAAGDPVEVRIEVDGGDLASSPNDTDGGHLHLYVDGRLQQMPYGDQTEVTLPAGAHLVTIEYVDHDHLSYDPPITAQVTLRAK